MSGAGNQLARLKDAWAAQWPDALALWSKFTKLGEPRWCFNQKEEAAEGLIGSFAMIRLTDQAVVISLSQILEQKLGGYALEIMAHEIGHHVYCPADLSDQGRMIARMRRALPTKENLAGFIANLYTDLLINDRLQRSSELRMAEVFKIIASGSEDRMWNFYMRIYEILWSLQKGTLTNGKIDTSMETDAQLGARVIRVYSRDWLRGSGKFAALCLTYLLSDDGQEMQKVLRGWLDTKNAGAGGAPDGLTEIDPEEITGATHPMLDEELTGIAGVEVEEEGAGEGNSSPPQDAIKGGSEGQCRQPFEYGEILKSLGVNLSDHDIAVKYYRERAVPYLVRFPAREIPETSEPLAEGLEVWDIGSPLEEVDWFESALVSDRIIPGYTTVQRTYGTASGSLPERQPVDLDLYVDCSGSMPNPQRSVSYLTLAGAIISLSALRAGSRVQATLWSGKNDFQTTGSFIRDEEMILKILTGYIGGATAFPIHLLRDTYKDRKPSDRPVHILVISDDGVDTMFDKDEKGNSGWDIARMALDKGRAGGTFVLNLWREWQDTPELVRANKEGWDIHSIKNWEELVEFARAFSKANYGQSGAR